MKFFTKRAELPAEIKERVPPGQYLTEKWPVLHYGPVPPFNPKTWDFRVFGGVENEIKLSWEEFQKLDQTAVTAGRVAKGESHGRNSREVRPMRIGTPMGTGVGPLTFVRSR